MRTGGVCSTSPERTARTNIRYSLNSAVQELQCRGPSTFVQISSLSRAVQSRQNRKQYAGPARRRRPAALAARNAQQPSTKPCAWGRSPRTEKYAAHPANDLSSSQSQRGAAPTTEAHACRTKGLCKALRARRQMSQPSLTDSPPQLGTRRSKQASGAPRRLAPDFIAMCRISTAARQRYLHGQPRDVSDLLASSTPWPAGWRRSVADRHG